jgi:signal transduction histidine kinase
MVCLLDSDALAQILANLLSNVEKYVPGGLVEIASAWMAGRSPSRERSRTRYSGGRGGAHLSTILSGSTAA